MTLAVALLFFLLTLVHVEGQCDFRCANGQNALYTQSPCLPESKVCDGQSQCSDHSDERYCSFMCRSGFQCANGQRPIYSTSSPCLQASMVCDGVRHCADNSDESAPLCPFRNTLDCAFYCTTGRNRLHLNSACVAQANVCDGIIHCDDASDETRCQVQVLPAILPTILPTTIPTPIYRAEECFFRCTNGQNRFYANSPCVPRIMYCDGFQHCTDGSDERACLHFYPAASVVSVDCSLRCTRGNKINEYGACLRAAQRCDGFRNCLDGSDEQNCVYNGLAQLAQTNDGCTFRCANGRNRIYTNSPCVPGHMVCNGNADCPDRSDEIYC